MGEKTFWVSPSSSTTGEHGTGESLFETSTIVLLGMDKQNVVSLKNYFFQLDRKTNSEYCFLFKIEYV